LSEEAKRDLPAEGPTAFLNVLRPGDYFALLAYLPYEAAQLGSLLHAFRARVAASRGCATMFGYGPRYLHSTGQLHKGGPNSGVFIIVTAEPDEDLAIPGQPFSFAVLEHAQAVGDFQSLNGAGRRVLHIHLPDRREASLERVCSALA
jgi:hypothetical protein